MTATLAPVDADPEILSILNDPVMQFHRRLHDLRDLADEERTLTARLARLDAQLEDTTRGTPEARSVAQERREGWKRRLGHIEDDAHTARLGLARVWWQLPAGEKARLRALPGWPAETVAPKLAGAVWRMAVEGREIPGLAPF